MLLGFRRQFAPYVREGSKTHTLRARRKIRPRVGEACHCYENPRQKSMTLLGRWRCIRIEPALIYERADGTFAMWISDIELSISEKNAFAWCDGFRDQGKKGAWEAMVKVLEIDPLPQAAPWWPRFRR